MSPKLKKLYWLIYEHRQARPHFTCSYNSKELRFAQIFKKMYCLTYEHPQSKLSHIFTCSIKNEICPKIYELRSGLQSQPYFTCSSKIVCLVSLISRLEVN